MAKGSKKIVATDVGFRSLHTNPTRPKEEGQRLSFNFSCLQERPEKFKYSLHDTNYFNKLLERLRGVSMKTWRELIQERNKSLRVHPIDFVNHNVSEKTFGWAPDIDENAWQFSISSNEYGRVHGHYIASEDVFYVVWLDKNHKLYDKGYPQ